MIKKAIAPGKLILSGEHAVVYGKPAIAMAVDRYAQTTLSFQASPLFSFDLLNFKEHRSMTLQALRGLKRRLKKDYQAFSRGEYHIRDVIKKPIELSQFVLSNVFDKLNLHVDKGLQLQSQSSIPIGCGMGSSSATILSVLHVMGQHFQLDLSAENYLAYGLEAEQLQHGKSSGLDLQVSLSGGCLRFEQGEHQARDIPQLPLYFVNTGNPESTTGECVSHAKQYLAEQSLLDQFADVTNQMDLALQRNDFDAIKRLIRLNHQLLCQINVVPEPIQQFIAALEQQQLAAKICGAGACQGDNAGVVLIAADQDPSELCQQLGYQCHPLHGESHGLRAA